MQYKGYEEISVTVYDRDFAPTSITENDFAMLYQVLRPGTWFVVIGVTYTGDYIEAEERYETETVQYVVKMTVLS